VVSTPCKTLDLHQYIRGFELNHPFLCAEMFIIFLIFEVFSSQFSFLRFEESFFDFFHGKDCKDEPQHVSSILRQSNDFSTIDLKIS
jgi:hypothetical protein